MKQIANKTAVQGILGDFPKAIDDAVMDGSEAHQNQMMQLLSDPENGKGFAETEFNTVERLTIPLCGTDSYGL